MLFVCVCGLCMSYFSLCEGDNFFRVEAINSRHILPTPHFQYLFMYHQVGCFGFWISYSISYFKGLRDGWGIRYQYSQCVYNLKKDMNLKVTQKWSENNHHTNMKWKFFCREKLIILNNYQHPFAVFIYIYHHVDFFCLTISNRI